MRSGLHTIRYESCIRSDCRIGDRSYASRGGRAISIPLRGIYARRARSKGLVVPLPAAPIIEYKAFKVALIDSDGTEAPVRPMYQDQEFFGQTGNSGSTTNVGLFLVRLRPGKLPDKLRIVFKGIETTVRLQPEKR